MKTMLLHPGQKIILKDIDWLKFEQILNELGEKRSARIAYNNHILEIMTPLPEHESNKLFLTNFIEILLEELEIEFYPLGSTTFKNQIMEYGIEPDNCFYIENEAQILGKTRLDLNQDPPPDLALEIDVTSRTHTEIYQKLGVKELWCFAQGKLKIMVLETTSYKEVQFSPHFPNLPLTDIIPDYLERVKQEGRNKTIKAFRNSVKILNTHDG